MLSLPDDLTEFLRQNRQLEYPAEECECGQITLLPLGAHTLGEVWIDGEGLADVADDPNEGTEGYYAVPAFNLVATCDSYDPEHILSWVPDLGMYISWDNDHWSVASFPGVTWTEIAADPLPFVDEQWSPSIGEPLVPWPRFPFKKGRPF